VYGELRHASDDIEEIVYKLKDFIEDGNTTDGLRGLLNRICYLAAKASQIPDEDRNFLSESDMEEEADRLTFEAVYGNTNEDHEIRTYTTASKKGIEEALKLFGDI
jgi:hypothetical protein